MVESAFSDSVVRFGTVSPTALASVTTLSGSTSRTLTPINWASSSMRGGVTYAVIPVAGMTLAASAFLIVAAVSPKPLPVVSSTAPWADSVRTPAWTHSANAQ